MGQTNNDATARAIRQKEEIIAALSDRQHVLQVEASRKGYSTPPEVITEIAELDELIRSNRTEIAQLQRRATEGSRPLEEDEYRMLLAEAWDTPRGQPGVVDRTRLEWQRRRLGLSLERAAQLSQEIRTELVHEAFEKIDSEILYYLGRQLDKPIIRSGSPLDIALKQIGRAVRLDGDTAIRLLLDSCSAELGIDLAHFESFLYMQNNISSKSPDRPMFGAFIANFSYKFSTRASSVADADNNGES